MGRETIEASFHVNHALRIAARCHPGLVRPSNEDSVLTYLRPAKFGEPLGLIIVADGVGGHKAGEIASRLAVDTIYNQLRPRLLTPTNRPGSNGPGVRERAARENGQANSWRADLLSAVQKANQAIYSYALNHPLAAGNLGTTVACALISGRQAYIANVGDSRVYHFQGGRLNQVTVDHSIVHEMVQEGRLHPARQFDHPQRSIITRALGQRPSVEVDVFELAMRPGDRILVCSDGLWDMVRDDRVIEYHLEHGESLPWAADQLVESANRNGGLDNISVVIGELGIP